MKMLRTLLITIVIIIIGLICLGIIAWFVDYFFYSWTSHVHPFGCKYKKITLVSNEKRDRGELKKSYDLFKLESLLKNNPNYKTTWTYKNEQFRITRKFEGIFYNIVIQRHMNGDKESKRISFNNADFERYSDSLSIKGEAPSRPNYLIQKNINQMINELPLNKAQKDELTSKVEVRCSQSANWTF